MIAKHTKGPWRVGKGGCSIVADHPIEGGIRGTDNVETEGGHLVAETCAKVNIPLLSAATDLFDALEMVRDADDDCKRDGLRTIPCGPRAKIDAALKKATGETP